jgi:hypothetical protein
MALRRVWQRTHQVYLHLVEHACRDGDGVVWICSLLVVLSTLALLAVAAHSSHLFAHTLPEKTCSHQTLGATFARVSPTMMWMVWKTAALSARGLVMLHATSYSRLTPSTWTVLTVGEEDLLAWSVLGLAWLAAILEKEMPAAGCTSACQLPRQEVKV